MDIVSRLKKFISYLTIPVTQFADNCTIARPTLSQLLNGRNKKVSDELIGKIHDAYPELSVLWLMFGEGEMLHNSDTKTIPADRMNTQEASIFDFETTPISTSEEKETPRIDFNSYREPHSEQIESTYSDTTKLKTAEKNDDSPTGVKSPIESLAYSSDSKKKIVNIIVYYSDNSFESFVPNRQD